MLQIGGYELIIFLLSLIGFFLLLIIGFPVAFSLGIVTALMFVIKGYSLTQLPHLMTTGMESFVLIAVPFFILTGKLMNITQLTDYLFDFADKCTGHLKGGLGHVNILASLFFSGVSGSALADVQGLGLVEIKAMTDKGYDINFSAAVTIASSTIGPIVPPSIPMVIYAVIAEQSVGKLFLGGFIPGIIMTVGMMILVYIIATKKKLPTSSSRPTILDFIKSFIRAVPALIIPIILLGAIIFGIATPTEIGAISIVYILIINAMLFRRFDWHKYWIAIKETVYSTASILIIISIASVYGKLLAMEQVPQAIAYYVLSLSKSPIIFLVIVNLLLLFLGCFLESTAIMVIMLPILLPIATSLNVNLVHFGIIVVLVLMIGLITPPFGLSLFAISDMTKIPISKILPDLLPFYIPLLITLLIVTFFPKLIMFLPNLIK